MKKLILILLLSLTFVMPGYAVDSTITDLTELSEGPASDDEFAIWDTSTTSTKKITDSNLNRFGATISPFVSFFQRAVFAYSDADQITVAAANYFVKEKLAQWVSTITTTATGAAGGIDQWYLYLDYSAITTGTAITSSELIWSTIEPAWNTTYRGYYNSDDRAIFSVRTDGSNNILEFLHTNGRVYLADELSFHAATDIDDTFTDLTALPIPSFALEAVVTFSRGTADQNWFWRTNDQTGSTGHRIGYLESNDAYQTQLVRTDGAQIIEVKAAASDGAKIGAGLDAWLFPIGM